MAEEKERKITKKSPGLYILITFAVIFMVLAVIIVILFPETTPAKPENTEQNANNMFVQGFEGDMTDALRLFPMDKYLLKIDKDQVSCLDYSGKEVYSFPTEFQSPMCYVAGEYALIFDTAGTLYALVNSKGLVYSDNAKYTIDYGNVDIHGYASIIFDKPDTKGTAVFLDPKGEILFEWESQKSGFILSTLIMSEKDRIYASTYNTDGFETYTLIRSFTLGGDIKSQLKPDSHDLLPGIIQDMDGNIVLYGLYEFIYGEPSLPPVKFNRIIGATPYKNGILVIGKMEENDIYSLYSLKKDDVENNNISGEGYPLIEDLKSFSIKGDYLSIVGENRVLILDLKEKKVISELSPESDIVRGDFSSTEGLYVVVSGEGVSVYRYAE